MAPPPTRAALANVTMDNADALHCGVCCLPLKPPIFLCDQGGHFVCSSCRDKLDALRRSGVRSGAGITGGYRRCGAAEKLVESIRVPCPNAAHGCDATPPYYDHGDHLERCPHRLCRCPGESCGFTGGMSSMLRHFTTVHDWPCDYLTDSFWTKMYLRDGCKVLVVIDGDGVADTHLLVLTVSREHRGISVACVDVGSYLCKFELDFARYKQEAYRGTALDSSDRQRLTLAGLSYGLPDPDECVHFILPRSFYPDETEAIVVSAYVKFG